MVMVTSLKQAPKGAFLLEAKMSWFKHRPKVKEPSRIHPHTTSPMSEKRWEASKEEVKKPTQPQPANTPRKD